MSDESDRTEIMAAAAFLGIEVPDACLAGIAQNLALQKSHFAIVEAFVAETGVDE